LLWCIGRATHDAVEWRILNLYAKLLEIWNANKSGSLDDSNVLVLIELPVGWLPSAVLEARHIVV